MGFFRISEHCLAERVQAVAGCTTSAQREQAALEVLATIRQRCTQADIDPLVMAGLPRWLTWARDPNRQRYIRTYGGKRIEGLLLWLQQLHDSWYRDLNQLSTHVVLLPAAAFAVAHAFRNESSRDWLQDVPLTDLVPRMALDLAITQPWKSFTEAGEPAPQHLFAPQVDVTDFLDAIAEGGLQRAPAARRKALGLRHAFSTAGLNPDAISQGAHSAVELLHRYERDRGITNADLAAWEAGVHAVNVAQRLRSNTGKFTLFAKVLWLAVDEPATLPDGDAELAEDLRYLCAAVAGTLRDKLNGLKHNDSGAASELAHLRAQSLVAVSTVWLLDTLT